MTLTQPASGHIVTLEDVEWVIIRRSSTDRRKWSGKRCFVAPLYADGSTGAMTVRTVNPFDHRAAKLYDARIHR